MTTSATTYTTPRDTIDWRVREVLHLIDAKLRVVFLMRDPFERCWSAVRMEKRFKNLTGSDDALLQRLYASPGFEVRTRYDRTVRSLRATFPESALYFGLYGTMHEEGELRRLSDFLGVTLPSGASDHRFNASPKA